MSNPRYPEEFKIEAVKQVTERGLPVAEVATRLGMSTHSLYAWVKRYSKPQEQRAQKDGQHAHLRELGEECGKHRAARLMRLEGLRSQTGYRRRPGRYGGKPPVTSPNHLERRFNVTEPNKVWVTDITYIRTYEG